MKLEVGDALRDYVKKRHPELWKPGTFEVVVWNDSYSKLTITWTLADADKEKP